MKNKVLHILAAAAMILTACGGNATPDEPEQPKQLAAPAGVAVAGTPDTESIEFRWDAVNGASQYKYRLLKGNTEDKTGTTASTSVKFSGLESGTTYKFDVAATAGTTESPWSTRIEATTATPPAPDPATDPALRYSQMQIPSWEEDGVARAFPGAEGGGMYTSGGRGGIVYHVTKLDDDTSAGTLRYGIEKAERPCTIVFDVAGIIELKNALVIKKGDLTIAGQTAPGDGICIKNRYTNIQADNVIIRYIRFRLGDEGSGAGDSDDCIWGRYVNRLILDHCSMSWSIDECASFYSNTDMTMQWCIIGESMRNCKLHTKGSHGYGGIWGGENASFHHNILAHHDSRNPRFDHPHIYENHTTPAHRGVVDFRNNVIYDWGSNNSYGGEGYGAGKGTGINMIANCYKPGASSTDRHYFMDAYGVYTSTCSSCGKNIEDGYPLLYMEGNTHTKYSDISSDNTSGIYWHNGEGHANYCAVSKSAFSMTLTGGSKCYTTTHSSADALTATYSHAGASLRRDKVDERIASDARDGKGQIIDDIAMVKSLYGEAWPEYKATAAETAAIKDSDGDGMPDTFEDTYGLNKSDASDGNAKTIDTKGRYTNLEMYLHWLVRETVTAQASKGSYIAL